MWPSFGAGMALHIEYFRGDEKVMVAVFLRSAEEAKAEALRELIRFRANTALIRDMSNGGKIISVVDSNT